MSWEQPLLLTTLCRKIKSLGAAECGCGTKAHPLDICEAGELERKDVRTLYWEAPYNSCTGWGNIGGTWYHTLPSAGLSGTQEPVGTSKTSPVTSYSMFNKLPFYNTKMLNMPLYIFI